MEVISGIQALRHSLVRPVVSIGNFDGVHLAHQRILKLLIEKARARQGTAVVYTFRPHPQAALRAESQISLLNTYDERLELLAATGVDAVIEEPFNREFSSLNSESFFSDILLHRLSTEAVIVGYDFAFGKERQGHLQALDAFCRKAGVELVVVPPQREEDEIVSSSKIREYCFAGQVEAARKLMGRDFFYRGVVMKGDGRGRTLGFPTANLLPLGKLILPYGVYATRAVLAGRILPSVTNIGVRPTFGVNHVLIETHLLDQNLDLCGSEIEVRFVAHLRAEKKFSSPEELKTQIALDIGAARAALA